MLEALDKVAKDMGCYKTMTATTEVNESFHEEKGMCLQLIRTTDSCTNQWFSLGFKRAGSEVMSHHHFIPRKTVRPRDSSRDPSPNQVHDGYSEAEGKHMEHSVTPVSSIDT